MTIPFPQLFPCRGVIMYRKILVNVHQQHSHEGVWYQILLKSVLSPPSTFMKYIDWTRMSHSTKLGGNHSEISHSDFTKLSINWCPVLGKWKQWPSQVELLTRGCELFTFQIHAYVPYNSVILCSDRIPKWSWSKKGYYISIYHILFMSTSVFIRARSCP